MISGFTPWNNVRSVLFHGVNPLLEALTLDYGHWTLDYRSWTIDFGLWTSDFGLLRKEGITMRKPLRIHKTWLVALAITIIALGISGQGLGGME